MDKNINHSIGCSVTECRYHSGQENYCSLQQIQVGKSELHANRADCTECDSFQQKSDCGCR